LPARYQKGTIVDPRIVPQRSTDQQHWIYVCTRLHNPRNTGLYRVENGTLQMQIIDGVRRHAQFGIDDKIDSGIMRALRLGQNAIHIVVDICSAGLWCTGGDTDHAVLSHIEKRMIASIPLNLILFRYILPSVSILFWSRSQPVLRRAYAEIRQPSLHGRAGNFPFRFPAIDRPTGPGVAILRAELFGRKRRIVCLTPIANLVSS